MYSEEQRQEIMRKLNLLAKSKGISINKTGELTGVSSSVISSLKNGKYKGNADKYYEILDNYLSTVELADDRASAGVTADYVPTSISQNVYAIIKNCQLKGGLAIACGDAGVGKTKAVQKFVSDNPNLAIAITVNPCVKGLKSVLKVLADRLGVSAKSIDELWFAIATKLRDKMVLIFDESQHLPIKTIESLRAFSDYFADKGQTLGVVFVGNMETACNLAGNKRADFAQIMNRTKQNKQYYTRQITKKDIELLCPDIKDDERSVEFILAVARSRQALRGACNLYSNALDNENVTYEGLVAMAKEMEMSI